MKTFYTNVQCLGNNILYRGVKNGKRIKAKIEYSPSLYIPSKRVTNLTSLDGDYLEQKIFGNIREARDYVKKFDGISTVKIYGQTRFEYAYIADQHRGMVDWDQDKILVGIIDIEVGSENGFPDPYIAQEAITAIAIKWLNGRMVVFGCGEYKKQGDEVYIQCRDEWHLCKKFLELWEKECPDILTGWNIKFFDMPYLVNRFRKIVGEDEAKKLSPWKYISERKAVVMNKEQIVDNCRHLEKRVEEQAKEINELKESIENIKACMYQFIGGLYCQRTQGHMIDTHMAVINGEPFDSSESKRNSPLTHKWGGWQTTRQGDDCEKRLDEIESIMISRGWKLPNASQESHKE